jgi:hypothetical protein
VQCWYSCRFLTNERVISERVNNNLFLSHYIFIILYISVLYTLILLTVPLNKSNSNFSLVERKIMWGLFVIYWYYVVLII